MAFKFGITRPACRRSSSAAKKRTICKMSKLFNFSSQYFLEKFQQQDRDNVYCPIPTFYKVLDYKDLGKGKDSDPIPKTFPNMLLLQDSAKCIMRKQILWSLGHKTCHNLAYWLVITFKRPLISTHPRGKTILQLFSCDPSLGGLAALRIYSDIRSSVWTYS